MNTENNAPSKVVAISGGTSGLGFAVALGFCEAGYQTCLISRNEEQGEMAQFELSRAGFGSYFFKCDVRNENEVESTYLKIFNQFQRLDSAINCAGILDSGNGVNLTESEFDDVISTNLKGTWLSMKYQVPIMKKTGQGNIVNIASILAFHGSSGNSAYVASKHGIIGLTKTFALENLNFNIRVNAIAPGFLDTPMLDRIFQKNPDKRRKIQNLMKTKKFIPLNNVTKSVLWLCSTESASINGQCIVVDEGLTAGYSL